MWIIMAWQCTSPEVTVKGCKTYCMSSMMDETDGMLWNGSEKVGNIRSVCEECEGTDC